MDRQTFRARAQDIGPWGSILALAFSAWLAASVVGLAWISWKYGLRFSTFLLLTIWAISAFIGIAATLRGKLIPAMIIVLLARAGMWLVTAGVVPQEAEPYFYSLRG